MFLRSFLQLVALLLFALVFLLIVLIAGAHSGYLGHDAHRWVEWCWTEIVDHQSLIQKGLAAVGALATLIVSALGVYKTWHFADINLPARLEALCERWRKGTIRNRPSLVPELGLTGSIFSMPEPSRSWLSRMLLLVYDSDQAALLRCSRKVDKFEAELKAVGKSLEHCKALVSTSYLEMGSLLRRSDPQNGQAVLNLFKKPLERDNKDWDALELAGRQALAVGLRAQARRYLTQLVAATDSRHPLRHARALRFHAEVLRGGDRSDAVTAQENLERAIIALENSDAREPRARLEELGMAHEMLAKVQIALRHFRFARENITQAVGYVGETESLKELRKLATPPKLKPSGQS